MDGIAASSACTTIRIFGTIDMSLSARRIRSARSTASPWPAGTSATVTMTKSNRFHGLRKKERR